MSRVDYVETIDDLNQNIIWLETIFLNGNNQEKLEYRNRMAGGWQYYCCLVEGQICFGPSRIVGYKNNSFEARQKLGDGNGSETSKRVDRIHKLPRVSGGLIEKEFLTFCDIRGIKPHEKKREFWAAPDVWVRLGDRAAEKEILANTKIPETEKQRLISARIGQGAFRSDLLLYWGGACCLSGCKLPEVLRASHIKPWGASDNRERLDRFNGLLLAAHLDALFDRGLISFHNDGTMILAPGVEQDELSRLGIDSRKSKLQLSKHHLPYLAYHRSHVFGGRQVL